MKQRAVLAALLFSLVALAGCASDSTDLDGDDSSIDTGVNQDEFHLQSGRGAIAGLLVDDRFRPIQLTDDPETEFQATGFILLQETGQRVQTDGNGQFSFVDLEPGTYTLRAAADAHEATPQRITVEEGVFAEATLVARRVISQGSTILTNEYSAFIPCAASWLSIAVTSGIVFNCLDASAESYRPGPSGLDYQAIEDLTFMVAEYIVDQDGYFLMQVRGESGVYADVRTDGGHYGRNIIQLSDEVYDWPGNRDPWTNTEVFESIIFFDGFTDEIADRGRIGVATSIRGQMILSLFVGEPEIDITGYQLLNEDSQLD